MNTLMHPFGKTFSINQINFLKKTRLPIINCLKIDDKDSFLAFEAFQEITISYRNQAWINNPKMLKITRGKILYLAQMKGKDRDVRLIYENALDSYNIFIPWQIYLTLKREGSIVAFDVYNQ